MAIIRLKIRNVVGDKGSDCPHRIFAGRLEISWMKTNIMSNQDANNDWFGRWQS